jgi:hypothetical protein
VSCWPGEAVALRGLPLGGFLGHARGVKPMEAEELKRITDARTNFECIAKQASNDAGIMEVIITHFA